MLQTLYDTSGLSEQDRALARFRGLLEKKYQNDHHGGYTYVDNRTGFTLPLTPFMMKEWSRAMVRYFHISHLLAALLMQL